jgi:hypothetical protein
MKISSQAIIAATLLSTAHAFAPLSGSAPSMKNDVSVFSSVEGTVESSGPKTTTVFGWTPDASKPCYGLPGAIEPLGFFDPLEFTKDADLNTVKRFR